MAKPASSSTKPVSKPVKRARIEEPPSKTKASRVKGSPPPKKQKENVRIEPSAKSKGKQKEDPSNADANTEEPISSPPRTFKIVTGSYEKLLYGLEGTTSLSESNTVQIELKPIFMFPAHVSCIKAVAASPGGKWLATGSADEIIKVWDLRRKKEIGGLMHHEGSITHLHFASRSHLLSASEDGTLCLFHARDWSVLRTLKGHKARVNCIAVHPSGKVALSVGKDRALRMWDLMRGKGVASTKLGKEGEIVRWSTDGSRFVVLSGSTIDIYDTAMTLIHTTNHPSRLHDAKFTLRVDGKGEVLLIGAEDKTVSIYDVPTDQEHPPKIIGKFVGHTNRIKAMETLSVTIPQAEENTTSPKSTIIVSTVSSDGKIHVYDLSSLPSEGKEVVEIQPAAEYDTKGTRLTCITLAGDDSGSIAVSVGKRKRGDEEEHGVDDDEEDEGGDWGGVDGEDAESEQGEDEDEEEDEEEEEEEEEEEVEED
ncbi:Protein mak11 [Marasmius crinis-equi]|uniref:Protein mak11 n=1 Tax=Marasmius crinis-equi TaxID=585013 RepID=A0ABR3FMB7_9AGAR